MMIEKYQCQSLAETRDRPPSFFLGNGFCEVVSRYLPHQHMRCFLTHTLSHGSLANGTNVASLLTSASFFQDMVHYLSAAVSQKVYDLCDGIGDRPEVPPFKIDFGSKRKFTENDS